jgi:hypothetical protein
MSLPDRRRVAAGAGIFVLRALVAFASAERATSSSFFSAPISDS